MPRDTGFAQWYEWNCNYFFSERINVSLESDRSEAFILLNPTKDPPSDAIPIDKDRFDTALGIALDIIRKEYRRTWFRDDAAWYSEANPFREDDERSKKLEQFETKLNAILHSIRSEMDPL